MMKWNFYFIRKWALVCCVALAPAAPAGAESAAIGVVRRVYDAAVMACSSDLALQDAASIRIRNSFDFAALAQRAIGAPWQQADASDRAVVIDVIARSVVTGIIQRLGKYRVGGLTILEETALRGGDRLVRTSV